MAQIGSLSVKLGLVTVEWDKATDKAKQQAKGLQASFQTLSTGVQKASDIFRTYGSIVGSVSLAGAIASTIQFADEISDLAKGFDLTIGQTLAFRDSLIAAGVKSESAAKMMSTLFSKIDDARQGTDATIAQFEKLGITFTDLKTMAPYEAINKVAQGFSNITDKFEKVKLIKEFFGKAGIGMSIEELNKALEEGTGKFDNYGEKIKRVGEINDDLKRSFNNLQIAIADMMGNFSLNKVISIETYGAALKGLAAGAIAFGVLSIARAFAVLAIEIKAAAAAGAIFNLMAGPTNPLGIAIKLLALGAAAIVFFSSTGPSEAEKPSGPSLADIKDRLGRLKGIKAPDAEQLRVIDALEARIAAAEGTTTTTAKPKQEEQFSKEAQAKRLQVTLARDMRLLDLERLKIQSDFLNQGELVNQKELINISYKQKIKEIDSKRNQELAMVEGIASQEKIKSINALADEAKLTAKQLHNADLLLATKKYQYEIQQKILESHAQYLSATILDVSEDTGAARSERAIARAQQLLSMRNQITDSARLNDLANVRLNLENSLMNLLPRQRDYILEMADAESQILEYRYQAARAGESSANIDAMAKTMRDTGEATIQLKQDTIEAQRTFEYGWNKAFSSYIDNANNAAIKGGDMFSSIVGTMTSALDNFVRTGKLSFKDFARSIIQDLIAIQLKAQATTILRIGLNALMGSFNTGGIAGVRGATASGSGYPGGGFADGGNPPIGRASLVGERGPEIFIPKTAGTIIPNHALSGMGGTTNVTNNYINAIDTKSFEDRLLGSSNAIWAANLYANKSLAVSRGRA